VDSARDKGCSLCMGIFHGRGEPALDPGAVKRHALGLSVNIGRLWLALRSQ
jgi:hypothetical protein